MPKKIAFFLQSLVGGGAEKSVVNLANYYVTQGIDVDIVLVTKTGAYLKILDKRINVIDLKKSRSILSVFVLRNYLIKNQPDVLMASVVHTNIVMVLAKLCLFKKIETRLLVNQVNHLVYSLTQGRKEKLRDVFKLKIIACFYSLVDGVISMSQGVEVNLLSYGSIKKSKSTFIYNPVINDEVLSLSNQTIDKFEKKTFIAVGRLVKQKNFTLLIDAFAKVKEKTDAQLIILGEGELKLELEEQIKTLNLKDVHLLGFVDNPFSYMKQSDVLVLSSLWEGFGNVLAEALALGTQVVSTNCPSGPSEILKNGQYGFLVESDNVNALSGAMMQALKNPIDKKTLIERSEDFRIEKIADQYKKFLLNGS